VASTWSPIGTVVITFPESDRYSHHLAPATDKKAPVGRSIAMLDGACRGTGANAARQRASQNRF